MATAQLEDVKQYGINEKPKPSRVIRRSRLEIFVDMDGVVADFVGPALEVHGYDFRNFSWPPGVFEMEPVLEITTDKFWSEIDHLGQYFWSSLPKYSWATELIAQVQRFGDWRFLSSPSRHHGSAGGKVQWINKHFHGAHYLFANPSGAKRFMAGHGRVLIDDRDENCQQWRDNGGHAILIPQPWNSEHANTNVDRVKLVREELEEIVRIVQGDCEL